MRFNWSFFWEFVRFNVVGIVNTLLTFLVFSVIYFFTKSEIISLFVDYLFGLTFSYVMNGYFTFRADMENHRKQLPRMILSYVVLLMVNFFMLRGFTDYLNLNMYLSQLLTVGVIAISSYLLQKRFVFRNHGH